MSVCYSTETEDDTFDLLNINDIIHLEPLTFENFLLTLKQRFLRDILYTYISNKVISINPYESKLSLYSTKSVDNYLSQDLFELQPPHVYSIANLAYKYLNNDNNGQNIFILGESGSGKTEIARIVLQFLILASKTKSNDVITIKERLIQSGILLEAFGNATTILNDNSTRFGKHLDIEFDFKGDPIGGYLTHFYLERNRVTDLKFGERNFHIFYQLLLGADTCLIKQLKLQRNLNKYPILNCMNNTSHKYSNKFFNEEIDRKHFKYTRKALFALGYSSEEIFGIFQIIAVILKLSNIHFQSFSNIDNTESCTIVNDYEVYEICDLLRIDFESFYKLLTKKIIIIQSSSIIIDLNEAEARNIRNSLCRNLYIRLFTWIVNRINMTIKTKNFFKQKIIGLLDMFGFENIHQNYFEQFLINYCNEKVQNMLQKRIFVEDQEEYFKEDIKWIKIDFRENNNICDFIEKDNGLLPLYEYSKFNFSNTFIDTNKFNQPIVTENILKPNFNIILNDDVFKISHFAGDVTYSKVSMFYQKNHDFLSQFVISIMYRCKHPLMKSLFPEGLILQQKNPRKLISLSEQCKIAMKSISKLIKTRYLHYVFCIKPNELKKAHIFDTFIVERQISSFNLLPLAKLSRNGFYMSFFYSQFLHRYKMLSKFTWPNWLTDHCIEAILLFINDLGLQKSEFVFGKTKLFIRSPNTIYNLENIRKEKVNELAILIQKIWKGYLYRKNFLQLRKSQIIIASAWKSWKELRYGVSFEGRKHLWCLYHVANKEYQVLKKRKRVEWAVRTIQHYYFKWQRKQYLLRLPFLLNDEHSSPINNSWPSSDNFRLKELSDILKQLHHKIRCHNYRNCIDQVAKSRMREKLTASFLFKDKKISYAKSVSHPFLGDYIRLRQNSHWKKIAIEFNDQYVVFADIVNKIARSNGKFVPVLLVISTNALVILDYRTLQMKYRVTANDIYRLSLSPYFDNITVVHIKASDLSRKKGDFVFQSNHIIEVATKLFLVIQNVSGRQPEVNINSEFEVNFGQQTVLVSFIQMGLSDIQLNNIRAHRKGNKMEIIIK